MSDYFPTHSDMNESPNRKGMGKAYSILAKIRNTNEPIWVFRAQDVLAVQGIESYIAALKSHKRPEEFILSAEASLIEFYTWAKNNPTRLKLPD